MGETEIQIIFYADDAIIMAEHEDDLQIIIKEFEEKATHYNMMISGEQYYNNDISGTKQV